MTRGLTMRLLATICMLNLGFSAALPAPQALSQSPAPIGPDTWERLVDTLRDMVDECFNDPQCTEEELETYQQALEDALAQKSQP